MGMQEAKLQGMHELSWPGLGQGLPHPWVSVFFTCSPGGTEGWLKLCVWLLWPGLVE